MIRHWLLKHFNLVPATQYNLLLEEVAKARIQAREFASVREAMEEISYEEDTPLVLVASRLLISCVAPRATRLTVNTTEAEYANRPVGNWRITIERV